MSEPRIACHDMQEPLSAYLDRELNADQSCAVWRHVENCPGCARQLAQMRALQEELRSLPTSPLPPFLGLRLRVAASRYSVRAERFEYLKMRMQGLVRALAVPAVAGMMGAVCLIGPLWGGLARGIIPTGPDVPLGSASPARVAWSPAVNLDEPVVLEASVDALGRVNGYRVLSGAASPKLIAQLNNQLLMTIFQPATSDGRPTASRVLMQFDSVRVRG